MKPQTKRKIKSLIMDCLEKCEIVVDWPQYESIVSPLKALSNAVLEIEKEFLSETDVIRILFNLTQAAILREDQRIPERDLSKFDGNLSILLTKENMGALVEKVFSFYMSIPRKYDIYLPFPVHSMPISKSFPLSGNAEVVFFESTDQIPGFVKEVGLTALVQAENRALNVGAAYFRFTCLGYYEYGLRNKVIGQALANYKIFIQIGIIFGLFDDKRRMMAQLLGSSHPLNQEAKIVSVDCTDEEPEVVASKLPRIFSNFLSRLDINRRNTSVSNVSQGEDLIEVIQKYLKNASLLVSSSESESKNLKSAIGWFFDSEINEDETMSFVQLCMGLEAILGQPPKSPQQKKKKNPFPVERPPLTFTLADRLAYLVSNTIRQREITRQKFGEFYSVRSALIHGSTTEIYRDGENWPLFGKNMLRLAIIKEIENLGLE